MIQHNLSKLLWEEKDNIPKLYAKVEEESNQNQFTNRFMTEQIKILISKNKLNERLVIKQANYDSINREEIEKQIEDLSYLFQLDRESMKTAYYKCSGDLDALVFILNGNFHSKDIWNSFEDDLILSYDPKDLKRLIDWKGKEKVEKRKIFLKKISDLYPDK